MNWNQLKTILWLRWRLTRNQFTRGGAFNAVIGILGLIAGVTMFIGAAVGGIIAGVFGLPLAPPNVTLIIWDSLIALFVFAWLIGVVVEIQRSEAIDLARLLHLPVSLRGVFQMNYLASHFTFSLLLFLPATLGACLGLLWSGGPMMILLIPLVLSFVFMITAWTYCLRGWLVTLMVNPRKRRNVVVIATMSIVLLSQIPNIYINVVLHKRPHKASTTPQSSTTPQRPAGSLENLPAAYVTAHNYVPFLWLANGARALQDGNPWPAVWGSLGAFLLGAAGLGRAYQTTLRFYRGQSEAATGKTQAAEPAPGPGAIPKKNFLEKQVPVVTEDVAALYLAFLRSLTRAPEIKMALVTNLVMIVALGGALLFNSHRAFSPTVKLFIVSGAVALTFFGLIQLMFNQFGYDREGFRALVLLPAARRDVLFAKNLAFAPLIGTLGFSLLAVITFLVKLSPFMLLAGSIQLLSMFLLFSIAANFFSILAPYRVASGSMKAAKPPVKIILLIILTQFLFPVISLPIFIPPLLGITSEQMGWLSASMVDLIFSVLLLALAIVLYRFSLQGLGEFLERKEKDILLVVAHEAE